MTIRLRALAAVALACVLCCAGCAALLCTAPGIDATPWCPVNTPVPT